jgi:hypothetical protein
MWQIVEQALACSFINKLKLVPLLFIAFPVHSFAQG